MDLRTLGFKGLLACTPLLAQADIYPWKVLDLLDHRPEGAPFILSMGASWCPTCEDNLDILSKASESYPVIYIHYDSEDNKFPDNPLWYDYGDPKATILKQTGLTAMPTTISIGCKGEVLRCVLGPLDAMFLEDLEASCL